MTSESVTSREAFFVEEAHGVRALIAAEFMGSLSLMTLLSWDAEEKSAGETAPGRGSVREVLLPNGATGIVRRCLRGGFMRHVSRTLYCAIGGRFRPFEEARMLHALRARGVHVPKPAAACVQNALAGLCYGGFLVTEKIQDTENLLSLVRCEQISARVREAAAAAGREAAKMLRAGSDHADLHLGNVLVGADGEVFLIDFDKARAIRQDEIRRAASRLTERWQRSAQKHRAGELAEPFTRELYAGLL